MTVTLSRPLKGGPHAATTSGPPEGGPHAGGLNVATARARLGSIDLLRGLVMIVMVLDHTRDYVHVAGLAGDPTNLATTTPMLFLTRWVTHYCAPTFVFLAGVGAYLQHARGMSTRDLSRFLVTRGIWLIVLEGTVIRITTWFNLDYSFLINLQVIWTLGVSMIVLAALIHLPLRAVAGVGLAVILVHNAFDGFRVASWAGPGSPAPPVAAKIWILLHQAAEFFPVFGDSSPVVFVIYPLVPWIGVIAVGYACGALYTLDPGRRQALLRRIGLALIGIFIVLRATNVYGDPRPWAPQSTVLFSLFSFVNATKYPVSLIYLLMTIGPALLALAWFESRRPSRVEQIVTRVGRVPLFFYLWQWPLAHGLAVLVSLAAGMPVGHYFISPPAVFAAIPANSGFDLPVVYLCWATVLAVLIPLSLWFSRVKERNPAWWLKYL
jgi:uncharacterized membrane protein